MLHSPLLQCSCRFRTCRHIYMPWNRKEIVERKCSVGLQSIRLLGSTHSMLTVNTPLTLLLASLSLASEGIHCSNIRCLQAFGEREATTGNASAARRLLLAVIRQASSIVWARHRRGKSSKMHLTSWNTLEKKAKSVLTFLPKLKLLCANSTIREHKRWKSTKKEQQRFANPRKILTPYPIRPSYGIRHWNHVLLSQSLKTADGTTVKAF